MGNKLRFEQDSASGFCPDCGSVLGALADPSSKSSSTAEMNVCPSPFCPSGHKEGREGLLPGVDASLLYRERALSFTRDGDGGATGAQVGVIRAVKHEDVHDPVARAKSLVVATNVRWPEDMKQFGELFSHHVHHEDAPNVAPPNDGWDQSRTHPVL